MKPVGVGVMSLLANRNGSVTVTSALLFTALLGFVTLAIDGSYYFTQRRRQQAATDFAALAAASNLAAPSERAAAAVMANQFRSSDIATLVSGVYTPDPAVPAGQRFTPTTTGANAVRVTMSTTPPFIFGSALNSLLGNKKSDGFEVRTRATAVNRSAAAFALGTGAARLDNGLVNTMLGSLLGTNLSLSALDYQSLATTNVDLFDFADVLATQAGVSTSSYDYLFNLNIDQPKIFNALRSVAQGTPAASAAGTLVSQLATRSLTLAPLTLSRIVSLGPYGARLVQTSHPISAKLSLLDLVQAIARLAVDGTAVKTSLSANLPGIVSAQVAVVLGQPARALSLEGVGPVGAVLRSAQTRLLLTVQLAGSGQIATVTLPLYLQLAEGVAQLSAITCPAGGAGGSATLAVTPGLVDAWIGTPSDAEMADLSSTPAIAPATLLSMPPLVMVTAQGHAAIQNQAATQIAYSASDIAAMTKKTASTTDILTSLTASLVNGMSVTVSSLGGGFGANLGLQAGVIQIVTQNEASIDQLIASVLATLGVTVGNATTWVSGVRCGPAAIVD